MDLMKKIIIGTALITTGLAGNALADNKSYLDLIREYVMKNPDTKVWDSEGTEYPPHKIYELKKEPFGPREPFILITSDHYTLFRTKGPFDKWVFGCDHGNDGELDKIITVKNNVRFISEKEEKAYMKECLSRDHIGLSSIYEKNVFDMSRGISYYEVIVKRRSEEKPELSYLYFINLWKRLFKLN